MGIYNVASYETKELRKVIYLIRDILKSKSELNFGKVKYNNNFVTMEPNIDKIISKTSWRPKITFEEGIHKIISECYTTY